MATDTDIAGMEARAQGLRQKFNNQLNDQGRRDLHRQADEQSRRAQAATARATEADRQTKAFTEHRDTMRKQAREEELAAVEADGKGLSQDAQEHRERAAGLGKIADETDARIGPAKAEGDAARAEATQALAQRDAMHKVRNDRDAELARAEGEIDNLENKARYHREANEHEANATKLQGEADELRKAGKTEDADQKTRGAVGESIAADAKRGSADELQVDDTKLDVLDKPLVAPGTTGAQTGLQDAAFSDASGLGDAGTGGVAALSPNITDPLGTANDAQSPDQGGTGDVGGDGTPPSDTPLPDPQSDPLGTGSVTPGDMSGNGDSGAPSDREGGQLEHETAHQVSGDGDTGGSDLGGGGVGDGGFGGGDLGEGGVGDPGFGGGDLGGGEVGDAGFGGGDLGGGGGDSGFGDGGLGGGGDLSGVGELADGGADGGGEAAPDSAPMEG